MSNLAFFAADTLGMTLYQLDGRLESHEVRQMRVGPWNVELPMDVKSDLISAKEVTFWMKVSQHLKLYIIVREKESWLIVLDPILLMDCFLQTELKGSSLKTRMTEIKPAIKAEFYWSEAVGGGWHKFTPEVTATHW